MSYRSQLQILHLRLPYVRTLWFELGRWSFFFLLSSFLAVLPEKSLQRLHLLTKNLHRHEIFCKEAKYTMLFYMSGLNSS